MNPKKYSYYAIDVAKDNLQVQSDVKSFCVTNNTSGFSKITKDIPPESTALIICEASGGYERDLMGYCFENNIAVARVNPGRVRAFAASEGIRAKTDPIDAKLLLAFAKSKKITAMRVPDATRQQIAALMDRRAQLSEQLAREKNRNQKAPPQILASIREMITFIETKISENDDRTEEIIDAHSELKQAAQTIQSVKGVGKITAWTILAYLHEITDLNRNKLVALAGVAPFNKDTGKRTGKRSIIAGRAKVRRCLYMAAQSAAVHNPVIREYVNKLRERGKPYKVAIVAAIRKLLIHIQSLLKNSNFSLVS